MDVLGSAETNFVKKEELNNVILFVVEYTVNNTTMLVLVLRVLLPCEYKRQKIIVEPIKNSTVSQEVRIIKTIYTRCKYNNNKFTSIWYSTSSIKTKSFEPRPKCEYKDIYEFFFFRTM